MRENLYGNAILTVIAAALLVLIWQQHTISGNVDSISNRNFGRVELQRVVVCDLNGRCPDAITIAGTVAVTNESSSRFPGSGPFPLVVRIEK